MTEAVVGLISVIVGVFAGGGIWTYLVSRRAEPITRETAAVANAQDVNEMALAIAQRADERSLRSEDRITALETRLTRWTAFGHDLVVRWPLHRQSDTPPPLPE